MANLGVKVENILSKFYNVQQDEEIKGLYAVRPISEPDGEISWYFFNSNNATYHNPKKSSTSNVVIRDINQSNSGYLHRLKAAFEKAKQQDKKIFWLVLVFGEGIGLAPDGYDWLASVELRVSLDDITASLSMRTFPIGQGVKGTWKPCCVRIEQDKYFNTTFMSCKDQEGEYTSYYMKEYFEMYDNRAYRDVVYSTLIENAGVDENHYTVQELGEILRKVYDNAEEKMQVASIHVFGIKYGKQIIEMGYKAPDIVRAAQLNDSYSSELHKSLNIFRCLQKNTYGITIVDKDNGNFEEKENLKEWSFKNEYKNKFPRNRIVFGAPGTGKSHRLDEDSECFGKHVERVTFHPSYSYANFVGTYKPTMTKNESDWMLDEDKKKVIAVLQDKSKTAQEKYDLLYDKFKDEGLTRLPLLLGIYTDEAFKTRKMDGTGAADDNSGERNHGKAIRPYLNLSTKNSNKEISYEYVPGPFMRIYTQAINHPEENFLLLIEEINRANVAAVFGDVFQLLDRKNGISQYPIATSEDVKEYLLNNLDCLKGKNIDELSVEEKKLYLEMRIPANMFIWATMNSADQGVFPMDTAFKRRWEFEYIGVDDVADKVEKYIIPIGDENHRKYVKWNDLRVRINDILSSDDCKVNEDKLLGPFFITKSMLESACDNEEQFIKAFESKVIMYLFEDVMKMRPANIFKGHKGKMIFSEICKTFGEKGEELFGISDIEYSPKEEQE